MINFYTNVNNLDSFAKQENDDVFDEMSNINYHSNDNVPNENENVPVIGNTFSSVIDPEISDDELHEKIRTLNKTQRQVFEVVNDWVRTYTKSLACNADHKIEPIHTGSAGCGKSHWIKTNSDMLNKALFYRAGDLEKDKTPILAHTGVAAINVEGNKINSALGIPVDRRFTKNISKAKHYCNKRNLNGFKQAGVAIQQRLTDIFGCSDDFPFAGISVIACGDFYQLPPIHARPIYADYKDVLLNVSHCWKYFKIAKLTEVMRQRGDQCLIKLLNNITVGKLETRHEDLLKPKFILQNDPNYPKDAIHIFAENQRASVHNKDILNSIALDEINIEAIDKIPENIPVSMVQKVYSCSQMETGGLA
ncbi:uncharacterized protein LOC130612964 [Hydractinia symbiolongicarpus]|uniref:uncharacterized protein LOC130612964 n=1 Tax=Hydractinia symbiolongicarpus TaxID=13093 RepID=UPI00254C507A|nr:uncharacterized protein LOC130612964 [Hydractinia symbiolongicarpus]